MYSLLKTRAVVREHIIWLFLIVGLYFPTSYGATTNSSYGFAATAVFVTMSLFLLEFRLRTIGPILLIFALLCLSTLISYGFNDRHDIRIGAVVPFVGLCVLLSADLKDIKLTPTAAKIFRIVSVFQLLLTALIIVRNRYLVDLIINYYSYFYQDLVPTMLYLRKPVLSFASHSIAALGAYLFFYLNFQCGHRIIAFCYILACFALTSFSGFGLGALGLFQFLLFWARRRPWLTTAVLVPIVSTFISVIIRYWDELVFASRAVISFTANGLIGRYGPQGNLRPALEYLWENPLFPIGFTNSSGMLVGDSGPIEFLLRGSVLLLIVIYVLFAMLLRRNLQNPFHAKVLIFAFLLFDLGYTSLTYFRFWYLIVFSVIYLNSFHAGFDNFGVWTRIKGIWHHVSLSVHRAAYEPPTQSRI